MADTTLPAAVPGSAARRIGAMILRYWYLLRGSWPRLLELAYWPTVQMIVWGLITLHLQDDSGWLAQAAGVLVAGVLLWDVLFRGQLGVSISFLEEMWSRNFGHLFISPLRPVEWVAALTVMSLIRTLIGIVPAAALAVPFFGVNVLELGLPLVAFFANLLICGWWIALIVICLILRFGMGAESLAWALVFLILPLSAVYYPVAVLPGWAQGIALALPPAHVFEGMRAVLFDNRVAWGHLAASVLLNLLYLGVASGAFLLSFRDARRRGALLQQGE